MPARLAGLAVLVALGFSPIAAAEFRATVGDWRYRMWDDGWTAVTADYQRTAQFEHTLVVTADGCDILTLPA